VILQITKKVALIMVCLVLGMLGCGSENPSPSVADVPQSVPREQNWGIYSLDLTAETVELVYSSASEVGFLDLNKAGDTLAFSQHFGGDANENEEICTVKIDGRELTRITDNNLMDIYPVWSPDGAQLAFLSWRDRDLDIYVMDSDGSNQRRLYDSGSHDADIDWVGHNIVFTSGSQIWIMQDDGTNPVQITDPPDAGVWGDANLPFGDYDPRLSPDGRKIVFERLEDDASPHGNYNFFVINADGSGETRLTDTGYSQGIASWSHSQTRLVFVVAAIGSEGKYDIYMMDSDGSNITNINPDYFPPAFLCHSPVFSADDSKLFFIGQWWE
jgi:Tol biopolymer transport system component